MTYDENRERDLWFESVSKKVIEWSDLKPDNKDLKELVKGLSIIGVHYIKMQKELKEIEYSYTKTQNDLRETVDKLVTLLK
jgi:hypothetical protein|tara:strand:- start:769 stop:1011 length:243 start_codon:yes stop_codon:yes gene_type:complete